MGLGAIKKHHNGSCSIKQNTKPSGIKRELSPESVKANSIWRLYRSLCTLYGQEPFEAVVKTKFVFLISSGS